MFENYTLEILYKDENLVAINKPTGLLVHKSMIDRHEIYFAMKILRDQIDEWVYPVHRLDKPTSGVLLFALNSQTARLLSEQFSAHTIEKKYISVVRGYIAQQGEIDHAITFKPDKISDKDSQDKEPQDALTYYKRLATVEMPWSIGKYEKSRYSLVELAPKTGRKHQLRRHMKHLSHHIVGDTKYGRGEQNKMIREKLGVHRLLLHSTELTFLHPYTKEKVTIKAELDITFKELFSSFGWKFKL